MERHQAQLVLDYLDIIKHFAKGGMLEFQGRNWKGDLMPLDPVNKGILINCLPNYRIVDKFIQVQKKHCTRWCPIKESGNECHKYKTGETMITANSARELALKRTRESDERTVLLANELMVEISLELEKAVDDGMFEFSYNAASKYGPCMALVSDKLKKLGYDVSIVCERALGSPYIITVKF